MIHLIRGELFKAVRLKKMYFFMCIIAGIEIIQVLQLKWKGANGTSIDLNGQSLAFQLLNSSPQIMIIFIAVLIADMIVDDYRNGTLKLSLLRPVSRVELLNAKVASFILLVAALLVFLVVTSYMIGTLAFGWGDHAAWDGITYTTDEGIWLTLQSALLALLPSLGFGMIVIFIALLSTSMGVTIGLPLGLMVLSPYVEAIQQVKDYFIVYQMHFFHLHVMNNPVSLESIKELISIMVYFGLFYLGSVMIMKKKDILL